MKRSFTALVALAALGAAVPARATTFPALALIYVASGVTDSGSSPTFHYATSVHCTNVSGQNATVRWIFYTATGASVGSYTQAFTNVRTVTVSTQTSGFSSVVVNTGAIFQGVVTIYSTQSGVFCSGMIVDPSVWAAQGVDLHMVRFNAHPGTVE